MFCFLATKHKVKFFLFNSQYRNAQKKALLLQRINNDGQLKKKSKTFYLIQYNSFTNYTMVVTPSKNIKIGIGRTNFELLTSYFLSIVF